MGHSNRLLDGAVRKPSSRLLVEDQADPNIFTRDVSPCEISNDPQETNNSGLSTCNISEYLCQNSNSSSGSSKFQPLPIPIQFDYDIVYNSSLRLSTVVAFLEETILNKLAEATGVSECRASVGARRRRRIEQKQSLIHVPRGLLDDSSIDFTFLSEGQFAGVSLEPKDMVDTRYNSCPGISEGDGLACAPMNGSITAFVRFSQAEIGQGMENPPESEHNAIQSAIRDYLQGRMEDDSFRVAGFVEMVRFVGTRSDPASGQESSRKSGGGNALTKTERSILWAAISMFVVLVVLIICYVFRRCHRKQREKAPTLMIAVDIPEADDEESGISKLKTLAAKDSLALLPQDVYELRVEPVNILRTRNLSNSPGKGSTESENSSSGSDIDVGDSYIDTHEQYTPVRGNVRHAQVPEDNLGLEEEGSIVSSDTGRDSARRTLQMN